MLQTRLLSLLFLLAANAISARVPWQKNAAAVPQASGSLKRHLGSGYDALRQVQYERAEVEFRAALAIDPSLTMRARFPLAVALFEQHKHDEARREFEAVQRAEGQLPGVLYYLGRLDLDEQKYKAAVDKLTAASGHMPFADTAFYLGLAYRKMGSDKEAEEWFRKAATINPSDSRSEYELAKLYQKQGREEEAKQAFERSKQMKLQSGKASQLKWQCGQELDRGPAGPAPSCAQLDDPNNVDLLTALGILYGQHGQLEKALPPLQRAAELAPQAPQMQYNLAYTYYQLKRFADARAPLEPAVQRWPDLFQLNALYGAVLFNLGDMAKAYGVLKHARELNSQDAATSALFYQCTLAMADQTQHTAVAESLNYLEEAALLAPNDPEPHQRMAALYRRTGRAEKASVEDKKAAELSAPSGKNSNSL